MTFIKDGSERLHKRLRVDASILTSSSFTASEEIWFEDGNIILVCESIRFRVYKGILSSLSEVFRDMFSIGNPSGDETFDGCAIVHLSDSALDILPFLKTLYDRNYGRPSVHDVPRHDLPLSIVTGILRVATKYLACDLQKEMVDDLKTIYPSMLHDLLDSHDGRNSIPDFNGILAVNIAIDCRIQIILPVAYYHCSLMSMQTLLEGFRLESGVVVKLSPSALRVALTFREEIIREIIHLTRISRDFESQRWKCPHSMCGLDPVLAALDVKTYYLDWTEDGIFASDDFSEQYVDTLCDTCFPHLRTKENNPRLQVWDLLPKLCGEESWEVLGEKQQQIDRYDDDLEQNYY